MKIPAEYQREGAAFLASGGVMLADDPGTGKTLQAIEACKLIGARRVLVICPAVALAVWRDEVRDCWPEQNPLYLRDLAAKPDWNKILRDAGSDTSVCLITGYEYLLRNKNALRIVAGHGIFKYDALICDEAHRLKTPTAKTTIMIYGPGCAGGDGVATLAERTWLLTGTPQLNHPGEWFPHVRRFAPERLDQSSYQGFTHRYCTHEVRTVRTKGGRNMTIETITGANRQQVPDLARRLRGFWLRRRAEDVLDQLPPLRVVTRTLAPDACDPDVIARLDRSPEALMIREALETGDPEALRAIEAHVSKLRRLFAMAKVSAAVAWVLEALEQGEPKVSLWGWHVDALRLAQTALRQQGAVLIDGGVASADRGEIVKRFQEDAECRVFVGQIQAAGQAITLTAARRAVFLEQAWTPALNHQAAKRHHRIGQHHAVLAEVLAVDGSIDHAVQEILARKAADIEMMEAA